MNWVQNVLPHFIEVVSSVFSKRACRVNTCLVSEEGVCGRFGNGDLLALSFHFGMFSKNYMTYKTVCISCILWFKKADHTK